MINNSYNSRQEILLSRNYRGTIYSRDGDVLAETRLNEGVGEEDSQEETRIYPYGKLFAHVVGYSTKGRTGVEALANYYLINTSPSLYDWPFSRALPDDVSFPFLALCLPPSCCSLI